MVKDKKKNKEREIEIVKDDFFNGWIYGLATLSFFMWGMTDKLSFFAISIGGLVGTTVINSIKQNKNENK